MMTHLLKPTWITRLASRTLSPFVSINHYCSGNSSDSTSGSSNSEVEGLWGSKEGLARCAANHVPLSPIGFLERAAKAYRDRTSVVYGSLRYTWSQTHQRCLKLASVLTQLGVSRGDVVATLAPNVPAMHELHFVKQ